MPLHQMDPAGRFVRLEETPFPGLESRLEDWIEANSHLLMEGEMVAIIGRQPRTAHGKFADLLGIDSSGAAVIIELKRGVTPRDVIAQTLEYAAWVDSLSVEQLDEIARAYAQAKGIDAEGVVDLYRRTFESEEDGESLAHLADHLTFNHRQRMIIVAESFLNEIEQTIRYLRTKHGIDISGVRFGVYQSGGNTILETETVVGREPPSSAAGKTATPQGGKGTQQSDEAILARVQTPFMQRAVTAIEDWAAGLNNPDLKIRHSSASNHMVWIRDKKQARYYYAERWVFCLLWNVTPAEADELKLLSEPDEVKPARDGAIRFHISTDVDLEIFQKIILARLQAQGSTGE